VSDHYRCSFDSVADVYERARPSYAPDALGWIADELPLRRVLDLAAGTGKLTRQLAALGADVVAVEPGEEMRRVFAEVLPGIEVHEGSAEAIPLGDGSVDAVTVGQAFHWFRTADALAEMHRVLRPGGGFALLWNADDHDDELMAAIDAVVEPLRTTHHGHERQLDEVLASPLFCRHEQRDFRHVQELDAEVGVARVSSVSAVAGAAPGRREAALREVRKLVGSGTVRFPMITKVMLAHRA
jgi:ubiquinone/menaquinone biosynthesis C-methylase UbiE